MIAFFNRIRDETKLFQNLKNIKLNRISHAELIYSLVTTSGVGAAHLRHRPQHLTKLIMVLVEVKQRNISQNAIGGHDKLALLRQRYLVNAYALLGPRAMRRQIRIGVLVEIRPPPDRHTIPYFYF